MKRIIFAFLALSLSISSYAGVCRNALDQKAIDNSVLTTGSGIAATVGLGFLAGGSILVVPVVGAGVGAYWLVWGQRPSRLVKLIDQANVCEGKILNKAYGAYTSTHSQAMSKDDFCDQIVKSDNDGSLCSDVLPTVRQIGKFKID